jgi:hypothetical protein
MQRRRLLAQIGSVSLGVGFAGCNGGGGTNAATQTETPRWLDLAKTDTAEGTETDTETIDPDAPSRLTLLGVTAPQQITYGDSFEAQIVIGNAGGQDVAGNSTVNFTGGVDSETIELNSAALASGETRTRTVTLSPTTAGEWRFETGDGFDAVADGIGSVTVEPRTGSVGEPIALPGQQELTIDGVTFQQALVHDVEEKLVEKLPTKTRPSLATSGDGQVLAIVTGTLTNNSDQAGSGTIGNATFAGADMLQSFDGAPLDGAHIDGQPLSSVSVEANSSTRVFLVFRVLEDLGLRESLELYFSEKDTAEVSVGMRPEVSVPTFELEGASVPREREVGDQTFTFVVTNTSDVDGTFRGAVQWQYPSEHGPNEWYHLAEAIGGELPAGETSTFEAITDYDGELAVKYRLLPFGHEWEMQPL